MDYFKTAYDLLRMKFPDYTLRPAEVQGRDSHSEGACRRQGS